MSQSVLNKHQKPEKAAGSQSPPPTVSNLSHMTLMMRGQQPSAPLSPSMHVPQSEADSFPGKHVELNMWVILRSTNSRKGRTGSLCLSSTKDSLPGMTAMDDMGLVTSPGTWRLRLSISPHCGSLELIYDKESNLVLLFFHTQDELQYIYLHVHCKDMHHVSSVAKKKVSLGL